MATVKKANVPPTHPTVWVGLALAVIGLLIATYAYTGARVYEIAYAFTALFGALLSLAGILIAAWGRSIMAARASRSRRAVFKEDAMALAKPVPLAQAMPAASEDAPTIAAPREKKRFSFPMPKRSAKKEEDAAASGSVFAFKRRAAGSSEPPAEPAPAPAADDPRHPEVAARLAPEPQPEAAPTTEPEPLVTLAPTPEPAAPPVRVTLKCPSCATTFTAEGVRPFQAVCTSCGFSATV